MPDFRRATSRRTRAFIAFLAMLAACERTGRPSGTDTSRTVVRPDTSAPTPVRSSAWDRSRFGSVLLVQGDDPTTALEVAPDSGATPDLTGASATLLRRNGSTAGGTLADRAEVHGEACAGYPGWRVSGDGAGVPWAVGLVGATVRSIALDSLDGMPRADSARLTAEVTRLASLLPSDGGDQYQGLPFAVRTLWRFPLAGAEVIVAGLVRQVNQEAQPLEERTMLIAERDSASSDWHTSYYERSRGNEETVEARDVLAAAYLGAIHEPLLVIGRDYGDSAAYSLLERTAGQWRLLWTSPRVRC